MRYELFAGSLEDLLPIRTEPRTYRTRDAIYRDGSPAIHYVHTGIVRTFHTTLAGRMVHHDFYPTGEIFGESCLSPDYRGYKPETAIAHTPAIVSTWTAEQFQELALNRRQLVDALVLLQMRRHRRLIDRLERSESMPVKDRLMAVLIDTAYRIGKIDQSTATIAGITHEVLASMTGTSREIVTTHLNGFREKGKLEYSRRQIVLYRIHQIRQELAA